MSRSQVWFPLYGQQNWDPKRSSNTCKVTQLIWCFPNSGIPACQCDCKSMEDSLKSKYYCSVLAWSLVLRVPIPKVKEQPLPPLTPARTLMVPTYAHSGSLSTSISFTHVAVITSWHDPSPSCSHLHLCWSTHGQKSVSVRNPTLNRTERKQHMDFPKH